MFFLLDLSRRFLGGFVYEFFFCVKDRRNLFGEFFFRGGVRWCVEIGS